MPSINQALYDAANRHQIFLTRFGTGLANRATKLLDEAEADLTTRIASRASKLKVSAVDRTSARYVAIQRAIRAQSRDLTHALNALTKTEFAALAVHEVDLTDRRVSEALGVDLGNFRPPPEVMRTLATEGVARQRLSRWWKRLSNERVARLESSVALGIIEGDTTDDIVRRFRLAENTTRNSARTLVRTHVNHVANRARQAYYDANSDLIKELRWTATLDGRTSDVCKARDGQTYALDAGPRPPAHPNCRSVMSPILPSFEEFATTPLKAGRGSKDFDTLFQKRLQERGFSAQKAASIRANTRSSMNGQVPDKETYDTWLRKQPDEFITETLGPTKAQLFTRGDITLDRFVEEPTGRSYTLDEIKRLNEQTWMKAFPGESGPLKQVDLLAHEDPKVEEWHRAAFAESDEELTRAVSSLQTATLLDEGGDAFGAHYSGGRGIRMGRGYKPADRRASKTWAHEVGHAIDYEASTDAHKFKYASENHNNMIFKEGNRLAKNAAMKGTAHRLKEFNTPTANTRLGINGAEAYERFNELNRVIIEKPLDSFRRQYFKKELEKHGFDYDDAVRALTEDDGWVSMQESRNSLTWLLVSLERKDPSILVNKVLGWDAHFDKGGAGHVADFFGGLSKNRIGYGHSNAYYESGGRRAREAFANYVMARADTNKFFLDYYRHMAPETIAAFDDIMKRAAL